MRFLCIDLGDKRTGLAVCDENETIASPVDVIHTVFSPPFYGGLVDKITEAVKEYQIEALVFGLPLNMDGSENERTVKIKKFVEKIKSKLNLPIYFQDERLSTYSAQGRLSKTGLTHKKKKGRVDAIAAAEILQEFISSRKNIKQCPY